MVVQIGFTTYCGPARKTVGLSEFCSPHVHGMIRTLIENRFLPDLVKGDLDSLRLDVKEYYEAQVHVQT
jgi:hypothetical protein